MTAGRPKLLITPIFHDFSRFFPVFPGTFGRAPWIPGVQTLKMGERWGKMGKKWVKNEITGVQKTALMHASAHLSSAGPWRTDPPEDNTNPDFESRFRNQTRQYIHSRVVKDLLKCILIAVCKLLQT